MPGALYGDGDWLAFAEIDRAVFEAGVSVAEAGELAASLQAMLDEGEAFANVTSRLLERVPALKSAKPALANQPARGLRMLVTAFTARTREDPATASRTSSEPSASVASSSGDKA